MRYAARLFIVMLTFVLIVGAAASVAAWTGTVTHTSTADFSTGTLENLTAAGDEVNLGANVGAGQQWTQATASAGWSVRSAHTSVVFDNKMWVIGGYQSGVGGKNDVWYSSDGVTWTQATASAGWSARMDHTSVVYDGKMWVIGGHLTVGYKNDVWYSSDGVTWTQATAAAGWSDRAGHSSVVFDNKMWVMGGFRSAEELYSDVWYSSDGVTWTQATAAAGWGDRRGFTLVVFNNKMWVIGGDSYAATAKNDVWYSSDGVTWTQATAAAGWGARTGHSSVVYNNKMWVIGGRENITEINDYCNDVWYSSDGVTWTQATASAGWSARMDHTSVVYDGKMWVIGSGVKNDVWYSSDIYFSLGTLTSTVLDNTDFNITSATASWNASVPAGTSIAVYLSNNNGATWEDVQNGVQHAFAFTGSALRYCVTFTTTDNTKTPELFDILINYNLDNTPPPTPSLISPSNGENILDNTPTFEWTSVTDPSGVTYQIQIDDNCDFSSPVYAVNLTENTHTLLDENSLALGTYFWRVRAVDEVGNVGDWSEQWNFTVVPVGAIGVLLMPLLMLLPLALMLWRQNRRYHY